MSEQDVPIRLYRAAILQDRYTGVYAGGQWIAVAETMDREDFMRMFIAGEGPWGDDSDASGFWWGYGREDAPARPWLAVGETPGEALTKLIAQNPKATPA